MDTTNQIAVTVMGRLYAHFSHHASSIGTRLLLIAGLALFVHLSVKAIRNISEWLVNKGHEKENPLGFMTQQPKFVTLIQLVANAVTFVMYFLAVGLMLQEFGIEP